MGSLWETLCSAPTAGEQENTPNKNPGGSRPPPKGTQGPGSVFGQSLQPLTPGEPVNPEAAETSSFLDQMDLIGPTRATHDV